MYQGTGGQDQAQQRRSKTQQERPEKSVKAPRGESGNQGIKKQACVTADNKASAEINPRRENHSSGKSNGSIYTAIDGQGVKRQETC